MQLTPNYKLKKPEGTDPVDIQDFNDNADLIDAALKKKAESSGGDISGMTVKTLDDITTEFPVPVAGESTKTFLGKVKKFFSDTKNWMTGVCLIGQIVNNCVTNNARLPLSAAQGKVLMDLYNVLNTNLSNKITYIDSNQLSSTIPGVWTTLRTLTINKPCIVMIVSWATFRGSIPSNTVNLSININGEPAARQMLTGLYDADLNPSAAVLCNSGDVVSLVAYCDATLNNVTSALVGFCIWI